MEKENILANIRKKGFALNVQLNRDDIILENHLRYSIRSIESGSIMWVWYHFFRLYKKKFYRIGFWFYFLCEL